ncbi:hypothetical protein OS493_026769 [Desmophyllum pertusum]|uniref:Uncharacterized protein n=1 Tax=Desmophyllum pertusum TaxID=174260 RepID=A0A9W9ZLG0_9CNID|nr:hypothetical protein OS493_026769 [Desmophyllum pertusum]
MKGRSFVSVVAILVLVLVIAVQEVQLVHNMGRRFGRSLGKNYRPGRIHRGQVQFYRQQTSPQMEDEDEGGQFFNDYLPGFEED